MCDLGECNLLAICSIKNSRHVGRREIVHFAAGAILSWKRSKEQFSAGMRGRLLTGQPTLGRENHGWPTIQVGGPTPTAIAARQADVVEGMRGP